MSEPIASDDDDLLAGAPGTVTRRMVSFARQADGSVAAFPLIAIHGASAGPTAAFIAGIHGDEYEGVSALWALTDRLDPKTLKGNVLIVPVANAAAFGAGTRTSPVDGENLARIFPGDPHGTLSHRLAHALFTRVVAHVDLLVDSHSGGVRLAFLPVAGFYDANADAGITPEAAADGLLLARQMGIDFLWRLPPVAGVLSYEAARRGISVCGVEIGGRGTCRPEDAALYLEAYLSVLAHRGLIEDGSRPLTTACLEGDWERTPLAGYLDTQVALGARIAAGEVIARLRSPFGEIQHEFIAPHDGRIMAVRHLNAVQHGDLATCLVRETTR